MAQKIVSILFCVSILSAVALADYVNPPGWESNPYFTHQSWEFNAAPANWSCIFADEWVNAQGRAYASTDVASWQNNYLGLGRSGLLFSGPLSQPDDKLTLCVPNTENLNLKKEVWFQATLQTNVSGLIDLMTLAVLFPDMTPGELVSDNLEIINYSLGLFRYTAIWELDPQPCGEIIFFSADLAEGQWVFLDEFDVDTRCIPEPATVSLLVLGAGALLRRRK